MNLDNCSCVEVGGGASPPAPTSHHQQHQHPIYSYDHTSHQLATGSAPSLSNTACVEGEDRDVHYGTNNYLTLGPETGLNEAQHRRSASFESEMSYQMRRFLVEQSYDYTAQDAFENEVVERDEGNRRFLKQDVNIGYGKGYEKGYNKSRKAKKGSKVSWVSDGPQDEGQGVWTLGARCVAVGEMGGWVEGYGAGVEMERDGDWYGTGMRDERPMVLSGFTEYVEEN